MGAYGGAALILAFALRIGCLAELIQRLGAARGGAALILVASLSRTAPLALMTLLPPARMTGSSYAAGRAPAASVILGWLVCVTIAILVMVAASFSALGVFFAFVLAAATALFMTRLSARLIGGLDRRCWRRHPANRGNRGLLIAARP